MFLRAVLWTCWDLEFMAKCSKKLVSRYRLAALNRCFCSYVMNGAAQWHLLALLSSERQ